MLQRLKSCLSSTCDDFFADRLCHRYTTLVLVASAVVIALTTSLSNDDAADIACWCPAQFTSSHVTYTNRICAQKFTDGKIVGSNGSATKPNTGSFEGIQEASKYLPLVLVLFGLLIIVPRLLWKNASFVTGYSVESTIKSLSASGNLNQQILRPISAAVMHATLKSLPMISFTYLLTKCLYSVILVAQIVVLNCLMDANGFNIGELFAEDDSNGEPFNCSFQVRHAARVHDYVVQCVGNPGNPPAVITGTAIFIHAWLYFCLATVCLSTLLWAIRLGGKVDKVKRVSLLLGSWGHSKEIAFEDFADKFLTADGTLILKLVEENVSLTAASELVSAMWQMYGEEKQGNEKKAKPV